MTEGEGGAAMRPWQIVAAVAGLGMLVVLVKEYPAVKRYIKMERM